MPVFKIENSKVKQLKKDGFPKEKGLQNFCESNLEEIFGVRFVKTEHTTGEKHSGRIDSLGLDEDGNPVILEYKKREDENIINQGLFYLDWLLDHRGDFQILVQEKLGGKVEVSWEQPRVILVAQAFSKYDKHAINRMPVNLELWTYNLYENGIFNVERIGETEPKNEEKSEKKEIIAKGDVTYNFNYHINKTSNGLNQIFHEIRERILELAGVEERSEQKTGISYRTTISFVRFEFHKNQINMMIRSPRYNDPKNIVRDVTSFGWGYKGLVKIEEGMDADYMFLLVKQSYEETL
jgi:predicted transport protein